MFPFRIYIYIGKDSCDFARSTRGEREAPRPSTIRHGLDNHLIELFH